MSNNLVFFYFERCRFLIKTKRVYEKKETSDGFRVLVDRLWPRGIKKEDAGIDLWLKEIAPSDGLRKWFNHIPERWNEFKKKYFKELEELPNKKEIFAQITNHLSNSDITLLYSAKDNKYNNAIALKEYLQRLSDKSK